MRLSNARQYSGVGPVRLGRCPYQSDIINIVRSSPHFVQHGHERRQWSPTNDYKGLHTLVLLLLTRGRFLAPSVIYSRANGMKQFGLVQ
jgi:hypothetical protein